ncbi:MAG: hypothetical protein HY211_08480 [Candidatus Omnitrophica bacterium]|nr:hypothetical protein [Candidatus Omnitrophota bacterium]
MLVQDGPTRHRGARKMRDGESKSMTMGDGGVIGHYEVKTTGWHPTCVHDLDPFPCTVLDPFCGSGTVGVIALRYNRKFIGIELKAEYVEMARKRIAQDNPLFNMEKKGESSSLC